MRRFYLVVLSVVFLLFGGTKLVEWWKYQGLITLNVTDAEVYPVLKKIARQSGIPILARTNTAGRVTVHFYRTPVEEALDIITEQTDGRWQKLFLIGHNNAAIKQLGQSVIEQGPPFLITQMAGRGDNLFVVNDPSTTNEPTQISFKAVGKKLQMASLELALKIRTPIAIEESLDPMVNFEIKDCDLHSAVKELARAANARTQMAYHFRTSQRRNRSERQGDGSGSTARVPGDSPPSRNRDNRQERQQARQKMMELQMALLSPEDQQKIQQQRAEWQQWMTEMARLSPEERQQKWAGLANDTRVQQRFDKGFLGRIKNLTPEQRVERYRRYAARRARQEGRR